MLHALLIIGTVASAIGAFAMFLMETSAARELYGRLSAHAVLASYRASRAKQGLEVVDAMLSCLILSADSKSPSAKKIAMLSFISSAAFIASIAPKSLLAIKADAPITVLLGGGVLGQVLAAIMLLAITYAGHVAFDFAAVWTHWSLWKRLRGSSTFRQFVGLSAASIALIALPFGLILVASFVIPGFDFSGIDRSVSMLLFAGAILFNGPVILGLVLALSIATGNVFFVQALPAFWPLLLLSCAASYITYICILLTKAAISFNWSTQCLLWVIQLVPIGSASKIRNGLLVAFGVFAGLLTLLGISVPIRW